MPEGDRFEKGFGSGWRGALTLVRGGVASEEEVADKLGKALAKTLRDRSGVPGHEAICRVMEGAETGSLLESFQVLDDIDRSHEGHRHTKVATDVAKSLLVQGDAANGMAALGSLPHRLASETCSALVDHYFFGRAYPQLIAEGRFVDHEHARQWQDRVEQAMQPTVAKFADKLVSRPDAQGLRAPRRSVPKESTRTLLKEDLFSTPAKVPAGLPL